MDGSPDVAGGGRAAGRRSPRLALLALLGLAFAVTMSVTSSSADSSLNLSGTWKSVYHCHTGSCAGQDFPAGPFALVQAAGSSTVTGGGSVGTLVGHTLSLHSRATTGYTYTSTLTVSPDGRSWSGTLSDSNGTSGTDTGTRLDLKPSLRIVCDAAKASKAGERGCESYSSIAPPVVPISKTTTDAAPVLVRYEGKNWNPQGPRISLIFGGKIVRRIAPTADFQHDIYGLIWPQRSHQDCFAEVGARQGAETLTHTLTARAIGRVLFVDNEHLLKFGDAVCEGEETTFQHTGGTLIVLTEQERFDYFSGGGTRLRGVSLPNPSRHVCFELFPKRRGVVTITRRTDGKLDLAIRRTC